jgi:hypothetical protein
MVGMRIHGMKTQKIDDDLVGESKVADGRNMPMFRPRELELGTTIKWSTTTARACRPVDPEGEGQRMQNGDVKREQDEHERAK